MGIACTEPALDPSAKSQNFSVLRRVSKNPKARALLGTASQSSVRWIVTSSSATQLARLHIPSPQRSAPRHQAAFRGAAPEPRSGTCWLRRLREPSG